MRMRIAMVERETKAVKPLVILVVEDDPDDQFLTKEAIKESRIVNVLYFVKDGIELLDYLRHEGKFTEQLPVPDLILLDLNLPRMNGKEVLREIKDDQKLCHIPVVVLSTSQAEEDVFQCYKLGASGFITKPVKFSDLIEIMKTLGNYWFAVVKLPKTYNG